MTASELKKSILQMAIEGKLTEQSKKDEPVEKLLKRIKGWKDALISGNEVYYIGVQNDEPYMERVNPLYFSYDKSPDLEFIEDGSWCCRKMRLPVAEVYDRYYNKLDEKDLNKLNEMLTGKPKLRLDTLVKLKP